MDEPLLRVDSVTKRFGAVTASRNLSFTVQPGEIHALIGPNGSGKTTIINQLSGEINPDSGNIYFAGINLAGISVPARARMGLARSFQITSVFERLSVAQNLALAIQAHQGHSFRFWRRAHADPALGDLVEQALARVGLEERAEEPAINLSHGEKRQLDVGMALAGTTRLLLLDEPMAGMGPGGTVELSKLIRGLKGKLTILLVEHDMDVIFSLADRISVLVYGEAIATGTPREIRANPQVQRAYLGERL
ncbi:MAG: ABC transporter ATP-binding protein [Gammaproteobacteria bacterium]|nr:ABC transporter ATP-binding protein [Gammaproteobacteria bacterium]